jgi:hypothetical protein
MILEQSIAANAPEHELWQMLTGHSKQTTHQQPLSLLVPSFQKGAQGVLQLNDHEQMSVQIEDVEPGFSIAFSARFLLAKLEVHRFIGYNNQKFLLVNRIKLSGFLGKFWWNKYFKKHLLKSGFLFF